MLFFPAIYCPKQFHQLFYLIFPTTLEGKCYFIPALHLKELAAEKQKDLSKVIQLSGWGRSQTQGMWSQNDFIDPLPQALPQL